MNESLRLSQLSHPQPPLCADTAAEDRAITTAGRFGITDLCLLGEMLRRDEHHVRERMRVVKGRWEEGMEDDEMVVKRAAEEKVEKEKGAFSSFCSFLLTRTDASDV
jgi:hypothetical protein